MTSLKKYGKVWKSTDCTPGARAWIAYIAFDELLCLLRVGCQMQVCEQHLAPGCRPSGGRGLVYLGEAPPNTSNMLLGLGKVLLIWGL